MKRAVVLGGGGSRGSYELGVWTALRELGVEYDMVCGTSIGAINAAMMAEQKYDLTKELWETITVDQVMANGINLSASIEGMFGQIGQLAPFMRKYVDNRGADISPLIATINKAVDESAVRSSPVGLGVVTVKFPSLEPVEIQKDEIPEGQLVDYLLASSACFPAFPMHKIGEQKYIDGGYYDNLPVKLAASMGAEEFVAVDLSGKPAHPEYLGRPGVIYIRSTWPLGSILDFEREVLERNTRLGYLDAMRAYGKKSGFRYAFSGQPDGEKAERFAAAVSRLEAKLSEENQLLRPNADILTRRLLEYLPAGEPSASGLSLRGLELGMELLDFDPAQEYDISATVEGLLNRFSDPEQFQLPERSILEKLAWLRGKREGSRQQVIGCIYWHMSNGQETAQECRRMAEAFPAEFTAALFLANEKGN